MSLLESTPPQEQLQAADDAAPQPQAKAKRARRTPEELLQEAERQHQAFLDKAAKALELKKRKLLEKAVPLAQRKAAAFDTLTAFRAAVRAQPENADLTDQDVDAILKSTIDAAFAAPAA